MDISRAGHVAADFRVATSFFSLGSLGVSTDLIWTLSAFGRCQVLGSLVLFI